MPLLDDLRPQILELQALATQSYQLLKPSVEWHLQQKAADVAALDHLLDQLYPAFSMGVDEGSYQKLVIKMAAADPEAAAFYLEHLGEDGIDLAPPQLRSFTQNKSIIPMSIPKDPSIEDYIHEAIIVDAHDDEEVAYAWEQHFLDTLPFPFEAQLAGDRTLEGTQTVPVRVVGLHPHAQSSYRSILLWVHLSEQNLHVAARPEDLRGWEHLEEEHEEAYQTLRCWRYWTQRMT